ncbi:MAG: SPFH/Band 7/PHB domain protein [Candidatus Gastranaerophilales bacterium]|nr:SPFH/Band 7/PHB domain protein [Candidatus Gastranaerophilales bacterium]
MVVLIIVVAVFALILLVKGAKIVQQAEVMIIEQLGKYNRILGPGFHWIVPLFENPRKIAWQETRKAMNGQVFTYTFERERIDMRECVYELPRQNVITKDNAGIGISALIYFQIIDAKSVAYEIQNIYVAIEKLTQATLRNIIGEMDLDETFVSRSQINEKLRLILDDASQKWGIKVNRVELQDIIPPADIQASMEKQMKAERDKRAAILQAEGEKQSAILKAQGEKEAKINRAEGEKQSAVLIAEGNAQARVREAQGEAQAIQKVIEAIGTVGPADKYLIAMKYIETLQTIAEGQNNKVVYMPYEATGVLSSIDGIKQMLDKK